MKKQIILFFIFISILISSLQAQIKIEISTENKDSVNFFQLNEFYFVHHIFFDSFFLTDLYKQLNYEEMSFIVNTLLYKINNKNAVNVIIKNKKFPDAHLTYFVKENTDNGTLLAMLTTFHTEKRKFTKKMDPEKSLARWYFVKGDKLVYRKFLYSKELENEKKESSLSDLIEFYMFDSNFENDTLVKELIDSVLNNNNASKEDVFYAKIYLGEYYLLNKDFENAEKSLSELKNYFELNENNGLESYYKDIVNLAETEFEMMKRLPK
ncbi:MAG TPA: hypothetical protein PKG88_03990 [Bacteroidales bacterium]|nr:hypothetical protein [Bacteroidales bacterium]HPS71609.1 hypothetical protein [Bacteroidales bacterium]